VGGLGPRVSLRETLGWHIAGLQPEETWMLRESRGVTGGCLGRGGASLGVLDDGVIDGAADDDAEGPGGEAGCRTYAGHDGDEVDGGVGADGAGEDDAGPAEGGDEVFVGEG
jgi:hypothetical protein